METGRPERENDWRRGGEEERRRGGRVAENVEKVRKLLFLKVHIIKEQHY